MRQTLPAVAGGVGSADGGGMGNSGTGPGQARPWHGTLWGTGLPSLPHHNFSDFTCHQASQRLTRGQPRLLNNSATSVGWICKQFFPPASFLCSVSITLRAETFGEGGVSLRRQAVINTSYLGGILML